MGVMERPGVSDRRRIKIPSAQNKIKEGGLGFGAQAIRLKGEFKQVRFRTRVEQVKGALKKESNMPGLTIY